MSETWLKRQFADLDRAKARITELEAALEVAKGLDRSRSVEAREITREFVRLQADRIAELEDARDQAERERFRFGALNKGLSNRIVKLEAAVLAEREACAVLCDQRGHHATADLIRARPTP